MRSVLRVRVLGELAVERDGEAVALPGGRRLAALLGYLALHRGRLTRSELAGRLWPDVLEESARTSLRTALAELRRVLGPAHLTTTREQVGLAPDVWVDTAAFDELVAAGRHNEALELVRSDLLEGLDAEWVALEREHWRERVRDVLGRLAAAAETAGELEEAIARTRAQLALDPLSEATSRDLIRRLALAGDRPAALSAYTQMRERLHRRLGLVPSAETRRLIESLRHEPHAPAVAPTLALPPTLARRHRSPFVGRTIALDRLHDAWRAAQARAGGLVLVAGEPGIGKTRLAAEFAHSLHAGGAIVLYGRCLPDPAAPHQPFGEALRPYVAACSPEELRAQGGALAGELARLVPEQAERLPPLPEAATRDPAGARYRLHEATATLVSSAARLRPLLLLVDDLHWADRPTVLLFAHLARSQGAPSLLVATYRPSDVAPAHPLTLTLADLRREQPFERITLPGLNPEDVEAMVAAWLERDASPELASGLAEATGGNPFFVEELLRQLEQAGAERRSSSSLAGIGTPAGVKEALARRLARLDQRTNELLHLAAVVGRRLDVELLELATGMDRAEVVDALDRALAAQFLREEPERSGRYAFAHALVSEALYDTLSSPRSALLHSRVAEALEQLHAGNRDAHLGELAHHFLRAGTTEGAAKGADYAERAASQATARLAYEEAAAHLAQALEALTRARADGGRRGRLLLALGEAQLRAGDTAASDRSFEAAVRAAREGGDADLLGRAALGRSGLAVTILERRPQIVALLEEALAAPGNGDDSLRARLLARLAIERYLEGTSVREPLSERALATAQSAAAPEALADALNARHVALWSRSRLEERLAVATELIELAVSAGERESELQGRNWLVLDLVELGDLDAARRQIDEHARLADELRLPGYQWWAPMWRAMLAFTEGDLDELDLLSAEADAIGRRAGDPNADLCHRIQRGLAQVEREGFPHEIPEHVGKRLELPEVSAVYRSALAWHAAELGRIAEARRELEGLAADGFGSLPDDMNWLNTATSLAQLVAALHDTAHAAELYDLLLPYRSRAVPVGRATLCNGPVEVYLARLAATTSRFERANDHFEAARAWSSKSGARLWQVWTDCYRAEILIARARRGDRSQARSLIAEVAPIAGELGLGRLERHTKRLQRLAR